MILSSNEEFNNYLNKYYDRIKDKDFDFSLVDHFPIGDEKFPVICHKKDANGIEHGIFYINKSNLISRKGCPKCGREATESSNFKDLEYFLKRAHEAHGDKYGYEEAEYNGTNTKLKINCPFHGEFWQTPNNHYKFGCLECGREAVSKAKRKSFEEFVKDARKVHGNKYNYDQESYDNRTSGHDKCLIHCNTCGRDFWQDPSKHLVGEGCKYCNNSRLENYLLLLLEKNNIKFISQYTKSDTILKIGKGILRIDFYLPDLNIAFECQGQQHVKAVNIFGGEESFKKQLERDERKFNYCEQSGIKLYYVLDEKEFYWADENSYPNFYKDRMIFKSELENFIIDLCQPPQLI